MVLGGCRSFHVLVTTLLKHTFQKIIFDPDRIDM